MSTVTFAGAFCADGKTASATQSVKIINNVNERQTLLPRENWGYMHLPEYGGGDSPMHIASELRFYAALQICLCLLLLLLLLLPPVDMFPTEFKN